MQPSFPVRDQIWLLLQVACWNAHDLFTFQSANHGGPTKERIWVFLGSILNNFHCNILIRPRKWCQYQKLHGECQKLEKYLRDDDGALFLKKVPHHQHPEQHRSFYWVGKHNYQWPQMTLSSKVTRESWHWMWRGFGTVLNIFLLKCSFLYIHKNVQIRVFRG